ncbi:lipase 3 [Amyelois transitella]|uniref:lipase 3 n=1 Tax=Amyelois transitella TaxID=680683 RepID=UPI00298F6B21|nr:lipase 3 [Amyelois transitella]
MVPLTSLFLLSIVIVSCRGNPEGFLPSLAQTTREITGAVVTQPLFQAAAQGAGELIARTVYDAARLPAAIARVLGVSDTRPVLINKNNIADKADKILAKYHAGLGNEDAFLKIDKLIKKYGYPVEKHEIVTEDGYALGMFRIPRNGSAVFLMHGLFGSADDFVIAGPESGMAYLLAEEGYDVWLGNARGNKHSRRHVELQPSDAEFWDFSWHEIGYYDLPAMIDYVLNYTSQKSLKYVGHSQGTTSFFVMSSERPEYNDKVGLMVALSPVAYMSHAKSPFIRLAGPASEYIGSIMHGLGVHEFLPDNNLLRTIKMLMCGSSPVAEIICINPLLLTSGFGFAELNVTNLPVIHGHTPSGAAVKQVVHYGQGFNSGDFKQFDYGRSRNLRMYGSEVPPRYALEKIRAPVSLMYSADDWMAHPDDVDALYQRLGNAIDIHKIPHPQFNHIDFIWAKHFRTLIYERLRKLLAAF